MSNDTPYILRMDMVKLAQQRASEKFQSEWNESAHNASIQETSLRGTPSYPSIEDILEEARKIKDFVDKG